MCARAAIRRGRRVVALPDERLAVVGEQSARRARARDRQPRDSTGVAPSKISLWAFREGGSSVCADAENTPATHVRRRRGVRHLRRPSSATTSSVDESRCAASPSPRVVASCFEGVDRDAVEHPGDVARSAWARSAFGFATTRRWRSAYDEVTSTVPLHVRRSARRRSAGAPTRTWRSTRG